MSVTSCQRAPNAELPQGGERNVLLVTIDTLRSGALGFEGGPARTPRLDDLARGGLRFSFAHAHAVVTLPSHASILTGFYPYQHGYRENSGYRLAPGVETLAARLHRAGFATGAFIGAFPLDARFGLAPAFDEYDGRFDDSGTGAAFVIPERPAAAVVARARDWIRAQDRRWFAWVHVYEPHAPYRPVRPFDIEYASQPYYGEVAAVDQALGPLLDDVRRRPRPTLVVVTSDHGESLGEHGEETHGLFAYESTLHVPLVIADTSAAAPMSAEPISSPARHVDLLPTILDVLALPIPPRLPGRSLRTAASRREAGEQPSYFEAMSGNVDYGWAPLNGVLVGRRKWIDLPVPELYDVDADPSERRNLAAADVELGRALARRLGEFNAGAPSAAQPESAEVVARLRSLGYASPSARQSSGPFTERDDPKRLVDLDRRMHAAAVLDSEGRLDAAAEQYRRILAARPDMGGAARHLAFDEWRMGRADAAIETLQRIVDQSVGSGVSVQLGAYLTDSGHPDRAMALLERAVAADPTFDALNALGLAYARAGRGSSARSAFERALAIDPRSGVVHENIGAVHLDAGRLTEARRSFEQAIAFSPQSAQAHHGLAMTAARTGDRQLAIVHWTRAVELDPEHLDALYDLGIELVRDGQTARARRYLDQFARLAPPAQYAKELANARALIAR